MDTIFALLFRFLFSIVLLVVVAIVLTVVLHRPPNWTLDIGSADSQDKRFLSEFSIPETNDHAGITFRWSEPKSRILLHGAGSSTMLLTLRMFGDERAENADSDWRMLLKREDADTPLATMPMAQGWRDYRVLLPAGATNGSHLEAAPLVLESTEYQHASRDNRDLGVPLAQLRIAPLQAGASWGFPLSQALVFTWALVLLTILLSYIRFHITPISLRLAPQFIALIVAIFLIRWAHDDPFSLMWMLPSTPWILGIVTLVVIRLGFGMILELFGPKSLDGGESVDRGTLPVSPLMALMIIGMLVVAQVLFWSHTAVGLGIGLSGVGIFLMSFISSPHIPKPTQETLEIKPEPTPSNPSRGIGGGKRKRKGNRQEKSQGKNQESPQVLTIQRPPKQTLILPEKEPDQVTDNTKGVSPYIWLALIFAVALVLRFYRLDDMPYGLWRDEARHGLIALHMLQESSYRPIYVAANGVNMPALGFYPFALAIKLFGVHDWSMRTVTALAGALTVFPMYALVKEQFKSVPIGLLAAALLAASSWHITMSRFSFPSVFEPLLALTGLWLLLKVIYQSISTSSDATTNRAHVPKASLGMLLVAGVCLGLAVQNYHTGRVVPVVALLLLFIAFTVIPFRRWLKLLGMLTAGMVLALLPLLIYATNNPAAFNQRVGRVFIMGEESREGRAPLAVLDETVGKHAMMFNLQGDSNGRHHAPDKPMLDVLTGLGLLIGLGVVLRLWMYFMFLFPALAAAISIAPSLLAVEGPHAMRSIGAIAFVVIIAAIGYTELGATLRALLFPHWQAMREKPSRVIIAMSVALVAVVIALNSWTYFGFMAKEPAVWVSSYPIHTQIGSYLRDQANHAGAEQTTHYYVDEKLSKNSVFVYLTYGLTVQTFHDTTLSIPLSDEAKFIVSGYTYKQDAAMLAPYIGNDPSPIATGPLLPDGQSPSFYVYAANPQGTP